MKRTYGCLLLVCLACASLDAADWDPNDDTFDPSIHSVVVGDRSWLGDPSPFVHVGLSRTGYTYVNQTSWEGFPPSVQVSLMVPLAAGETKPPAGGMLLLNQEQTAFLMKSMEGALKKAPKEKRLVIKTAMEDAIWALTFAGDANSRFIQLENKTKEKTHTYRFTVNATKKLLGAIRHSYKKLDSPAKE